MEPDGRDVPVEIGEKVAFQWVHEGHRMVVSRCVRLRYAPLPAEWAREEWPPQIGQWQPTKRLGSGGNGEVWRARSPEGQEVAVKFLKRSGRDAYTRFHAEIDALRQLTGVAGVLPILEFSLPPAPSLEQPAWFAMPLAIPLAKSPAARDLGTVVAAFADIATTLSELASRGISHRDLKPDNLFWLDGRPVIGDFGLVDYPGKPAITAAGRKLGPTYYIAPEMLNEPQLADGRAADVYSLAKTLWVMATGQTFPIPGEQRDSVYRTRLSTYVFHRAARRLDKLVSRCTHHRSDDRPNMAEVARALKEWPGAVDGRTDARPRSCSERELAKVGVQLIDASRLILHCRQCGKGWSPMLRLGGKLPRGYWLCPNGCNARETTSCTT